MMQEAGYSMIFGLSADPVHRMHIDLVVNAARELQRRGLFISRILIVPVYRRNPAGERQKGNASAAYEDRWAMCRLAAGEIKRGLDKLDISVTVSRIEQQLAQFTTRPNVMVETLQTLQARESRQQQWVLLLGSDLFSGDDPEFRHWYRSDKLARMAILAIYPRPGNPENATFLHELQQKGACLIQLEGVKQDDISAKKIRHRLNDGDDPTDLYREGLLPEPVALYIKERGLYLSA